MRKKYSQKYSEDNIYVRQQLTPHNCQLERTQDFTCQELWTTRESITLDRKRRNKQSCKLDEVPEIEYQIKKCQFDPCDAVLSQMLSKLDKRSTISKELILDEDFDIWKEEEEEDEHFQQELTQSKPSLKLSKSEKNLKNKNLNFITLRSPTQTLIHIPRSFAQVQGGYCRNPSEIKINEKEQSIFFHKTQENQERINYKAKPFILKSSPINLFESEDLVQKIRTQDLMKKPVQLIDLKPYEHHKQISDILPDPEQDLKFKLTKMKTKRSLLNTIKSLKQLKLKPHDMWNKQMVPSEPYQKKGSSRFFKAIKNNDRNQVLSMLFEDRLLVLEFDYTRQTCLH